MNRRQLRQSIVMGTLTALTAVGCAGGMGGAKMGSGDVVADRQRLMKLNGASWADVQAKAKANNIEAIAVNAETMALNAMHIPALFPEGSHTAQSKAKPDVWQKWSEFEASAKKFQGEAEKLRDAARAKNGDQVQAIVKAFGKNACGQCHTPFRQPPPKPAAQAPRS